MKAALMSLFIAWVLLAALAALNWGELSAIRELSLGVATVRMPLVAMLLGPAALLTALYLGSVVHLRIGAHLQARRHARALQASRTLSDDAEASRLTALHSYIESGLAQQTKLTSELKSDVLARIDRQEQELRTAIDHAGNTLAAYIGELEDRLGKPGSA